MGAIKGFELGRGNLFHVFKIRLAMRSSVNDKALVGSLAEVSVPRVEGLQPWDEDKGAWVPPRRNGEALQRADCGGWGSRKLSGYGFLSA